MSTSQRSFPDPSLDRRQLLRSGGIALSLGAILAACGSDRSGSDAPGRLGIAEPPATIPDTDVNDAVVLRTAQSMEYLTLAMYDAALSSGELSGDETAMFERLLADHTRHADDVGALVTAAGGEPYTCANPFYLDRTLEPILEAIEGSDDPHRDLLNTAYAFESLMAASYQAMVGLVEELSLRTDLMTIGDEDNRHAATLAVIINPDELVSPAVFGEPVQRDADGFFPPYAIPATFGQLTGIELLVGAVTEEGTRTALQLQTPAENSYVYDWMSC
jgi:hypothetical protein